MMNESKNIEEAMGKIVRKSEFIAKMIRRILKEGVPMAQFAHRIIRNYGLKAGTS
jgi:hypothetical protein